MSAAEPASPGRPAEALKLSAYFGERDRFGGRFVADALLDLFAEHRIEVSVLLRGAAGFGPRHSSRTDRLLTRSEDLPVVATAVDRAERIEPLTERAREISPHGLITLERAMLAAAGGSDAILLSPGAELPRRPREQIKLTAYSGRHSRSSGRADYLEAVAALHEAGVAGATTLLGVDGTVLGRRRRARLLAANREVPTMTVAVGSGEAIARALGAVLAAAPGLTVTLERVRVLKRDGVRLSGPETGLPPAPERRWRKLTVYCGEQSRHRGEPLYPQLIRELRARGGLGATALRGVWGYHGDHRPHGDRPWRLRRRVPLELVTIEPPERAGAAFEAIDRLTDETGLVTVETVPRVL